MSKKSETIVTYTQDELAAMQERGETLSDWNKAAVQPLPDGRDPDDAMEDINWVTAKLPLPQTNVHASLRLDAGLLNWFNSQGRGYQTKINAILRSYYQQHMRCHETGCRT